PARSDIVFEAVGRASRHQHTMRCAGETRNQVELDPWRQRSRKVSIEKRDAFPALHGPAHELERRSARAECSVWNPVDTHLRVPLDDVAMYAIRFGHGQPELRVREIEPCELAALLPAFPPDQLKAGLDG